MQLHGEPLPDVVEALEIAGAEVRTVPVYRWAPPADLGPLDRLLDNVLAGGIDIVAFTSAPAAARSIARALTRTTLPPRDRSVRPVARCATWGNLPSPRPRPAAPAAQRPSVTIIGAG